MAHHGIVALGADLTASLRLAVEVEALSQQYWQALALGPPRLLTSVQMAEVIAKFADYRPD
jgi:L-fuculose-phosphate aldolase